MVETVSPDVRLTRRVSNSSGSHEGAFSKEYYSLNEDDRAELTERAQRHGGLLWSRRR